VEVGAIPNQTVIRARESTENTPAARRRRDISQKIHRLDPNAAPFTLLLQRARTEECSDPKFEWREEELHAQWSQVNNGAGYASGATAIVVDHARYFDVGAIVNVVRTGEKFRVTAVDLGTNTLTVVRGVGNTAAAALVDNDDLQIIGNAYAEGSPMGLEMSHIEREDFNYVQIFRDFYGATGTMEATTTYLGKGALNRLRASTAIKHKMRLERAALFGERNIDIGSTNNPRRYTGGALFFLTENIFDAGGALTATEVWTWMEQVYAHTGASSDSRVLFAAPHIITVMDQFALTTGNISVNMAPSDRTFGLQVKQWTTSHGGFNIIKHRLLDNGLGGAGYGGHGLLLDPGAWFIRHLPGRNTVHRPNIGADGDDGTTSEFRTEIGFQVTLPKTQGVLKGVV
jgi:hypothetical protein